MMKRRAVLLAGLPLPVHAAVMNFPTDFGAHPVQAIEWWYLTGLLGDPGGPPRFGYQLTFFRLPGPAPADHPSALAARQLLLGHVALSDLGEKRQRHAQRLLRSLPDAVQAKLGDTDLKLRDWTLKRTADGYRAAFGGPGFALELQLTAPEPPLLQGEAGLSRKGSDPEQFSHYYSRPQLATRAALTLFQLRRKDGRRDWAGGSLRTPGQPDRSFAPGEVDMQPTRHWTSPATGARWPVEWRLKSPAGEMRLTAFFDAQEIDARRSSGLVYWEGAARLLDAQNRPLGAGYLELTGYAGRPPLL